MKRILLTGSSGQVGWELHRTLMPHGEIIAPNREAFDLSKPETLRKKIQEWKPDLIINPAAYTAVDQAEDEPELAFTINATAPRVIAEEAEKLKIPLIHYSTDYIFDGEKKTPYKENDTPNPLNVYGESKLLGEQAIQQTIEQYLIIRTSWVYSHRGKNFVNTILKLAKEREELNIIDDQIGAPTSASLIANITALMVYSRAINNDTVQSGIYNLTANGVASWHGFSEQIMHLLLQQKNNNLKKQKINKLKINKVFTEQYQQKALRPKNSKLNTTKLQKTLNIYLPTWKESLMLSGQFNK